MLPEIRCRVDASRSKRLTKEAHRMRFERKAGREVIPYHLGLVGEWRELRLRLRFLMHEEGQWIISQLGSFPQCFLPVQSQ